MFLPKCAYLISSTYFRCYKKLGKKFDSLKITDVNYHWSKKIFYSVKKKKIHGKWLMWNDEQREYGLKLEISSAI